MNVIKMLSKKNCWLIFFILAWFISSLALVLSAAFLYLNPRVPETATFREIKLSTPLRILSADGLLIQEFGERLTPISFEDIPPLFIRALLDTEDKRFFDHSGIDFVALMNATLQLVINRGEIRTGASTITMQLVKNISGESEVNFLRKFKEMLLALKIERELSKQEILTLYLNVIPFGKHSHGIQAAAHTYYGKNVGTLTLAETAMLAGVPKAPEAGNPVNGPERALTRRNLVLQRMLEQDSISRSEYEQALNAPITAKVHSRAIELPSRYVAEMVRQHILQRFGSDAYTQGMVAHTTIDSRMQTAARDALTKKLLEYDRRHGYRGPERRKIPGTEEYLLAPELGYPDSWITALAETKTAGNQQPAIVTRVDEKAIGVLIQQDFQTLVELDIDWDGLKWARPYTSVNIRGPQPKTAADLVAPGDLIRIEQTADGHRFALGQHPKIEGALIALDPSDGAIKAVVGGFDFGTRQFNHATQARRQPGSNFKPFFYAGAMENGLTAASIYNDAPIVLSGGKLEEPYRPRNSGDAFQGNIRLREALYRSINLVSLRVLLEYGPANAIDYVSRFGFDVTNFPRNAQLAFGGGTIALTPIEIASGYATFANGGFKITPYLINTVDSSDGDVLYSEDPEVACRKDCEGRNRARIIVEPRVAHIMDSILSDVVRRGTGFKAWRSLKRRDLRGKTGTTNDADIWFSGYTPDLVATTWAGFSDNSAVGNREWGSTTPIETWIEFMAKALPPESKSKKLPRPNGLVSVKIDPETGQRTDPADPDGVFEIFREERVPAKPETQGGGEASRPTEEIF